MITKFADNLKHGSSLNFSKSISQVEINGPKLTYQILETGMGHFDEIDFGPKVKKWFEIVSILYCNVKLLSHVALTKSKFRGRSIMILL